MANAEDSDNAVGEAPERATVVLAALILVAAVANLNLAVANVALPDIGKEFDSSQTTLNLDRGRLLARPRRVGPLPRRARRPLRPQADAAARHGAVGPGLPAGGVRPERRGAVRRAHPRRLCRPGMAYPTTLALITALWSGPGAHEVDRAVVGARRRRSRRSGPCSRAPCSSSSTWGSVFLVTLPLVVVALPMALELRPRPRERDDRSGRQPRRHPVRRCWSAALILAINFAPVPDKGTLALGLAMIALVAADRAS